MTVYDFTGFLAAMSGLGLAVFGLLVAVAAGLRLLFVLRRPGKGRVARGVAVGGLVLFLCGFATYVLGDLSPSPYRRAVDGLAVPLLVVSLVLAILAGWRAGRRRQAAPQAETAAEAPHTSHPGSADA